MFAIISPLLFTAEILQSMAVLLLVLINVNSACTPTGLRFPSTFNQNCCVASWKALLHVLPSTSNIVTQQNFAFASWSSMLQQVELASTLFNKFLQLATTNFVAWQCLKWVVIRATTHFNLQCNNVALQIGAIFCSYYFTFTYNIFFTWVNDSLCTDWITPLLYTVLKLPHLLVEPSLSYSEPTSSRLWLVKANAIRNGSFNWWNEIYLHMHNVFIILI